MVGWYHQLNGHEFEQALGDGEGQGSQVCCSPCGHKVSYMTDQLNNNNIFISFQFSSVAQSCLTFATPRTAAHVASLSITNSQSLLKLMSIELVMPSNHLILCCPLLLLPSMLPGIRVFSNESVLCEVHRSSGTLLIYIYMKKMLNAL